ncbi:transcriptional regulator [Nocardia sp. NPDC048505]|uniref:ATP-binding protein n=3 Tax=unclassified Nocardia TaxID=2637762 RepID=UPI00340D60E5
MAIGLRAAPNALLGREGDLTALGQLLPESRVVTVLGPGGTGKTRIANEVGARAAAHLPVLLVELASVRSDGGVERTRVELEATISAALGLGELTVDSTGLRNKYVADARQRLRDSGGDPDEAASSLYLPEARQRLRGALSARPMLLILDNCEHMIEAVAVVVADLIGACPQLTVLTTSRAPLMITAETVYPLPPLAIDESGSPATDLFRARARAVRPAVRLDPVVVAQLCRTLDGLPLAIELAAARVRTLSVEDINERLADRFALLRSGDRSSPERHRTLHAVIEWSWNLLEPDQQLALRRLCRFPAGFTLTAAEVVAGADCDVAAAVDGLVNQSLLTVLDDDRLGTRYRMLETVREFGEEQLTRAGEGEVVMRRMAVWARAFAGDAADSRGRGDQIRLALSVAAEQDNLLAVLRYSVEQRDAVTLYTVFPVLGALWVIRGSHVEVMSWAERLLALDPAGAPDAPPADHHLVNYVLIFLHLAFFGANMRELSKLRMRVRRLLRDRTDLSEQGRFLCRVMLTRANLRGIGRALVAGVRSPDRDTRATALMLRANMRENMGDVPGSTEDALRALELLDPDDVWNVSMVSRHLAGVCGQVANYDEAVTYYTECLDLLRQLGTSEESVETRAHLAAALVGAGQLERARHHIEIALGPNGTVDGLPGTTNHLAGALTCSAAELALAEGDIDGGLRLFWRALELYDWPDPTFAPGPGSIMLGVAALGGHVLHGRTAETGLLPAQLVENARIVLPQLSDLPQLGSVACGLGSYLLNSGAAPARGLELLALAGRVQARQDYPSMQLARHFDLARTRVGPDRVAEARSRAAKLGRKVAAHRVLELLDKMHEGR